MRPETRQSCFTLFNQTTVHFNWAALHWGCSGHKSIIVARTMLANTNRNPKPADEGPLLSLFGNVLNCQHTCSSRINHNHLEWACFTFLSTTQSQISLTMNTQNSHHLNRTGFENVIQNLELDFCGSLYEWFNYVSQSTSVTVQCVYEKIRTVLYSGLIKHRPTCCTVASAMLPIP